MPVAHLRSLTLFTPVRLDMWCIPFLMEGDASNSPLFLLLQWFWALLQGASHGISYSTNKSCGLPSAVASVQRGPLLLRESFLQILGQLPAHPFSWKKPSCGLCLEIYPLLQPAGVSAVADGPKCVRRNRNPTVGVEAEVFWNQRVLPL